MENLTVFEQNGKLLTDSRDVAMMVDKPHADLMKNIRSYCKHLNEGDFSLVEYFIEYSYKDGKGEERPCYLCTKKGCDMIANKMTGKKGVIFTAKYTAAFEKMQDFISKGSAYSGISLKEQVESLEVVADMLHMNEASKILMLEGFYKSYNIPTAFLPKYENNGSRQLRSATSLIEINKRGISAVRFNRYMMDAGYLEERQRPSSSGKPKTFKALTEVGLKYGENAVSPHNQREVQPLYYEDSFMELFNLVVTLSKAS